VNTRFKYHIFICTNVRSAEDPKGCCAQKGSAEIRDYFKEEVKRRGLKGTVRANQAGCLDACAYGPSVVIYPEGVWYSVATTRDAQEILDRHIGRGEVVDRLLIPFPRGR